MKTKIITISREFGSGGRSIGKAVAERLQIPYYDKELIKQVAERTGFDAKFIEEQGEYAADRGIFSYIRFPWGTPQDVMGGMTAADFLWVMQREVILELAEKEPCVIVGRCADWILKDRPDCLHAFIHADQAFKAERIVRLYGESEKAPEARLRDKDNRRRANYKHFTGREWGRCENYDLTLNSGRLGIDRCVDLLVGLASEPEETEE